MRPEIAVMLGHHPVHRVGEDDIGLAGGQPRFDQLLEQRARIDRGAHRAVLGAAQVELRARADRFHEFVGQQHAVVQVQRLAVEIARRLADFEEFLDFRVADIEIAGRRAAPQRALRNGKRQAIHHPHEGNDAAGLAVEPDRLADAAHMAPIGADAAAAAGQPDILVPGADNALEAVRHRIEIAADRQAAPGAAVRQHGRRGHEPQLGDIVIEPLGVILIVGIGIGDAGEEILIGLARQQIAVVQRILAEQREQRIARGIGDDDKAPRHDLLGAGCCRRCLFRSSFGQRRDRPGQRGGAQLLDQFGRAQIDFVRHRHCRASARLHHFRACFNALRFRIEQARFAHRIAHRRFVRIPEIHATTPKSKHTPSGGPQPGSAFLRLGHRKRPV